MLSLQSVQGEQIQALAQSFQPQNATHVENTEKSDFSFMDLLRAEQQKIDVGEEKNVSRMNDEQKKPENPEKIAEKPAEEAEDDAVQEKLPQEQNQRVSQKSETTEKKVTDFAEDGEKIALVSAELAQVSELPRVPVTAAAEKLSDEPVMAVAENAENARHDSVRAEMKNFAWMYSAGQEEKFVLDEEVPEEIASALLDAHGFAVPDIDVGDDDLAKIQQLAAEKPDLFLDAAENNFVFDKDMLSSEDTDKKIAVKEQKTKPRLEITDLRTVKTETAVETENAVGKTQQKNGADFAFEQKSEPQVQMTMDMIGNVEQNITSSSTQTAAANGSNFQSMLANAIQENAPDFVKAGNIVLRDGNQGAINLILRPEALGNVKISLSLSDKVITGQITVQSQEAYNAFKDSIDSLKAAFAQNGFEAQGFDLNFAGQQNFAQGQQEWQSPEFAIRANRTYGELVLDDVSDGSAELYENSAYGIDIVA